MEDGEEGYERYDSIVHFIRSFPLALRNIQVRTTNLIQLHIFHVRSTNIDTDLLL